MEFVQVMPNHWSEGLASNVDSKEQPVLGVSEGSGLAFTCTMIIESATAKLSVP